MLFNVLPALRCLYTKVKFKNMSTENAQQPNSNSSSGSAKLPVMRCFIDIVQNDKKVFIGYLDKENYIEIQYVGWNQKGLNSYKIQIWRDECGCVYEEIKRFSNIGETILCAVLNAA